MTITEIAQKACALIGLSDDASITKAKEFARQRWATIWNAHNWKDSIGYCNLRGATDDSGRFMLHVPLERVRIIRYGNIALAPIDPVNVFQLDSTAFDSVGEVLSFCELGKDEDGNRLVQVLRAPKDTNGSFLVMGKMFCPALADDDSPFLTGCDDALVEFVLGDLWRTDQQLQKAASSIANASSFLDVMRNLDSVQSATEVRIIPDNSNDWQPSDLFND